MMQSLLVSRKFLRLVKNELTDFYSSPSMRKTLADDGENLHY